LKLKLKKERKTIMAFAEDLNNDFFADCTDFTLIPDGEYSLTIKKAGIETAKSSGKPRIVVEFNPDLKEIKGKVSGELKAILDKVEKKAVVVSPINHGINYIPVKPIREANETEESFEKRFRNYRMSRDFTRQLIIAVEKKDPKEIKGFNEKSLITMLSTWAGKKVNALVTTKEGEGDFRDQNVIKRFL